LDEEKKYFNFREKENKTEIEDKKKLKQGNFHYFNFQEKLKSEDTDVIESNKTQKKLRKLVKVSKRKE